VSNLHFDFLLAAAVLLELVFAFTAVALILEPGGEELGGVEVLLAFAEDIGGCDALRLVNGC
jgi:hypothetical protein